MADGIEASVPASALVNVQRVDANNDGDVDRLVLTGKSEEGYAIAFVVTGAAEVLVSADAETCKARFFTSARGIGELPSGWGLASGRELGEVSAFGLDERLHTAGRSRGYLELYDVEGVIGDSAEVTLTVGAWIGPGVQE